MGKVNVNALNWSDRFALIDKYKPADETICSALDVTQDELDTARDLRSAGNFKAASEIKIDDYASLMSKAPTKTKAKVPTATTHTKAKTKKEKADTPTTATKPVREPKKRGRKGSKIANAFMAIPSEPVSAEEFIAEHSVSLAVLRQSRRFDKSGLDGQVRVKQDKETKTLMVWRETADS